jgi:hypothetical protein
LRTRENGLGEQPQRLRIALESAPGSHEPMQRAFPRMTKWGMPNIMRQTARFHEIWINVKCLRQLIAALLQGRTDAATNL